MGGLSFPPKRPMSYTTLSSSRERIGHEDLESPSGRDLCSMDKKLGFSEGASTQSLRYLTTKGE